MKFRLIYLLLFCFTFGFSGCEKDKSDNNQTEQYLLFDKKKVSFHEGEQTILRPIYDAGFTPKRTYQWVSSNPAIVDITVVDAYSVILSALSPGVATVTLASEDGALKAICDIEVKEFTDDGVIRILTIGNSFSEDAVENYLHDLARTEDVQMVIGNLYIGGASLELHLKNARENTNAYEYRKVDIQGNKTNTANTSIETALTDEQWDYISFQQASPHSGQYETFSASLPALLTYVKEHKTHPYVKYILHQTWAYAQNSTHEGFANYGKNQLTMYNAIVDAVDRAQDLTNIDIVIPSGTAIQNGRTSFLGDNFTRDGYHLNLNIGRYTAACTWFEALTGKEVIGNAFKPASLSKYEAELAQHAAHFAILKPKEITELVDFQNPNSPIELTEPIFVDFGENSSSAGWNGLTSALQGTEIPNLKDKEGNYTGIGLQITERFNGQNADGPSSTNTDFNMPENVSRFSFYGNSKGEWNGLIIRQSTLKLTGLDKDATYDFCFFGARSGVGDNRETSYTLKGANEKKALLNTSNNTDNTACATGVSPSATGEITLTVTAGPNNSNGTGFYYLSAMKISKSN